MAIPDYESIMVPLLRYASDGEVHRLHDAYEAMADYFELSEDERRQLLPSGTQKVMYNRVGWARFYLVKAGLLHSPKRGHFQITAAGRELLSSNPQRLTKGDLRSFGSFREYEATLDGQEVVAVPTQPQTPEEILEQVIEEIQQNLAQELLARIKECTPDFFEQLVVDLLVRMGYGGSRREAGEVLGRSRDGGIDGIIKEDKLGLDTIYVQAKRWEGSVGRPEIQRFVGALQGVRARRGVFITTSYFTQDAVEYANNIETRVVLIDGQQLASLMIEYGLGVSTVETYTIKRLDSDYFLED